MLISIRIVQVCDDFQAPNQGTGDQTEDNPSSIPAIPISPVSARPRIELLCIVWVVRAAISRRHPIEESFPVRRSMFWRLLWLRP